MSEKLLRFLLDELNVIRLVCRACGAAVELPIAKLAASQRVIPCPVCNGKTGQAPILRDGRANQEDAFSRLANAIQDIRQMKNVDVQFVLPENPKEGSHETQG
jgi:hypothetical protein